MAKSNRSRSNIHLSHLRAVFSTVFNGLRVYSEQTENTSLCTKTCGFKVSGLFNQLHFKKRDSKKTLPEF